MKFKWHLMKEKVIDHLYMSPLSHNGYAPSRACFALLQAVERNSDWRTEEKDMLKEAVQIVKQWDIRNYKRLVSLFPFILPVRYYNRIPTIYMDDTESMPWIIEFT